MSSFTDSGSYTISLDLDGLDFGTLLGGGSSDSSAGTERESGDQGGGDGLHGERVCFFKSLWSIDEEILSW